MFFSKKLKIGYVNNLFSGQGKKYECHQATAIFWPKTRTNAQSDGFILNVNLIRTKTKLGNLYLVTEFYFSKLRLLGYQDVKLTSMSITINLFYIKYNLQIYC